MLKELIEAFLLITVAEMGDKTQLLAMTFATRYSVKKVIIGVAIGSALNHGLAIGLGSILSKYINIELLQILGGVMFLIFGFAGLISKEDEDEDESKEEKYGPILTVAAAFFIGELGDKTQLTAMTIATYSSYPIFILIGTTLGMILTSSIGIFVGRKIGGKVPEIYIKLVSSIIFIIFGVVKAYTVVEQGLIGLEIFIVISVIVMIFGIYRALAMLKNSNKDTKYRKIANELKNQNIQLGLVMESACLGKEKCINCDGKACLVGFIRDILKDDSKIDEGIVQNNARYRNKSFDKRKLIRIYSLTVFYYFSNKESNKDNERVDYIKKILEKELLGTTLQEETLDSYIEKLDDFNIKAEVVKDIEECGELYKIV